MGTHRIACARLASHDIVPFGAFCGRDARGIDAPAASRIELALTIEVAHDDAGEYYA